MGQKYIKNIKTFEKFRKYFCKILGIQIKYVL